MTKTKVPLSEREFWCKARLAVPPHEFTRAEFADHFGIKPNTASNWLQRLVRDQVIVSVIACRLSVYTDAKHEQAARQRIAATKAANIIASKEAYKPRRLEMERRRKAVKRPRQVPPSVIVPTYVGRPVCPASVWELARYVGADA